MNNYWAFEEIYKRFKPNDKTYEGENIPEFYKFDGYYLGSLTEWDPNLKTGKISYCKHCGTNYTFNFDYSTVNGFTLEELNSLYEKKTNTEDLKKHVLFKPDYDINDINRKFCKVIIPLHLKAREVAEGIYSQNDRYFLKSLFYIPELKSEYGKVVRDNIEQYVNDFDICGFPEKNLEIKSSNNISRSFGQDDYKEYSSYFFSIQSDLYILSLIKKIIYYNQDNFKTKIGSEIKTLTDKDLEFEFGNLIIIKQLIYPNDFSEIQHRKYISLEDTFLLRYYFLKFYNKEEHINHLKKLCEDGLSVWQTYKIISGKFNN